MLMLVLDLVEIDDVTIQWKGKSWSTANQAFFSAGILVVFGSKNLFLSFWKPGSLVLPKSDVVSVKLPEEIFAMMRSSHARLLAASAANPTVREEAFAMKSSVLQGNAFNSYHT